MEESEIDILIINVNFIVIQIYVCGLIEHLSDPMIYWCYFYIHVPYTG